MRLKSHYQKKNTIWEGDFNRLISTRKGDFSPSIDATEVALPKEKCYLVMRLQSHLWHPNPQGDQI